MIPPGIISADGHVCEPPNCYVDHIDPKYRDTAPRIVAQPDGTEAFVVHGMKHPIALGFIDGAGFSIQERNARAKRITFADIREAAYGRPGAYSLHGPGRDCRRNHLRLGRDGPVYAPRSGVQRRLHASL